MTNRSKTAIFARIGSRPIPRVARMMKVSHELGLEPIFCGAFRDKGLPSEDEWGGWRIIRLGRDFPLLNGTRPFLYVRSVTSYNWQLLKFLYRTRPAIVHASDFETMLAAGFFRLFSGGQLIYNIHDNLAQRYNVPAFVRAILNVFEGLNVRVADITLVPESFRRDALPTWCRSKVEVVRNTPEDAGYAEPELETDGPIRIFYGGWLDWGRGLKQLLRIADANDDVELTVAGEGSPEIVEEIRRARNVRYLGFLEHGQVMAETRRCHFVSALYDPIRVINRYAASNKLAEALAVGRPVIINSEMHISKSLGNSTALVAEGYQDVESIMPRLRDLMRGLDEYRAASRDARRIYEEMFAWHPVRKKIADTIGALLP